MFATLDKLFRENEIRTIDELVSIIKAAPITPAPIVRNLFYIFDWKGFIMSKFARTPLEHHSFYHSFNFTKEGDHVKFRCKRYPQDNELVPHEGIQLLKENIEFTPVGPTEFRIEKLELDKVFRSLRAYFESMELQQRINVSSSWDALRKTLESLPSRKNNLLKMKIDEFPEQSSTQDHPSVPQHLEQYFNEDELPEIRGEIYCNMTATNTEFSNNVPVNTDVVVYTRSKHNRPWVGRVVKHLSGGKFTIHWYKRRGRGNHFEAMNNFDGSPVLSDQENEVVMYWHIADQDSITDTSFQIPLLWLEKLKQEYVDHDLAYE